MDDSIWPGHTSRNQFEKKESQLHHTGAHPKNVTKHIKLAFLLQIQGTLEQDFNGY